MLKCKGKRVIGQQRWKLLLAEMRLVETGTGMGQGATHLQPGYRVKGLGLEKTSEQTRPTARTTVAL